MVEGLGVVASVVEEAAVGPDGRVEIAQPDEVDARAGQPVGQLVGLVGLEEGRGRDQADPMEPSPAPLLEAEPAVFGRDKALPAGRRRHQEREVEGRIRGDQWRRWNLQPVIGIFIGVERCPRGHIGVGRRGDHHVVDLDSAEGVAFLELDDGARRPGRHADLVHLFPPFEAAGPLKRQDPGLGPRDRPAEIVEKEEERTGSSPTPQALAASKHRDLQRAQTVDRQGQARQHTRARPCQLDRRLRSVAREYSLRSLLTIQ